MKKVNLMLSFVICMVFTYAQTNKTMYSSKSGKISYQYEIEDVKTTYTLIFDEYGKKQAFELASNVDGYLQKSKTIITYENMFVVNYEDKQVIKFPVGADGESMSLYGGDNPGFELSGMVADVTKEAKGKKGTGIVLGKQCDIYEYTDENGSKGKYWIYNGYLFKAEFIDGEGQHAYMEITDFKTDVEIDNSEFDIPPGFEVTDMSEMMEQMKKMQEMYGVPDEE